MSDLMDAQYPQRILVIVPAPLPPRTGRRLEDTSCATQHRAGVGAEELPEQASSLLRPSLPKPRS